MTFRDDWRHAATFVAASEAWLNRQVTMERLFDSRIEARQTSMSFPATNDWVVPALNDIARRLSATGQHDGANAVAGAAAVVQQASGARSEFGPPAPLTTAPMIEGNIVRFCVYSRNRR
jgi:hypothetical protein